MPDLRAENRSRSAQYAAAGGAILGGAAYANHRIDRAFGDRPKLVQAVRQKKLSMAHAGRAAGKAGVWAARSTALPLTAYGVYGLVRPKRKTEKLRIGRDVVKPMVGHATLRTQEKAMQERVGKRDASFARADANRLTAHKKAGRLLSLASGSMGVAALGLRAPSLAGVAVRRSARAKKVPALQRMAGRRGKATQASNTLGVLAIGTGSVGSFNYAAQQKLENARDKAFVNPGGISKSLVAPGTWKRAIDLTQAERVIVRNAHLHRPAAPDTAFTPRPHPRRARIRQADGSHRGARVVGYAGDGRWNLLDGESKRIAQVGSKPGDIFFTKRDDAFLRAYRQNISPSAEQGYKDLKSIRRQNRIQAGAEGTVGALVGGLTISNVRRHGARLPTIAGLAGTGLSALNSAYHARLARSQTRRIDKIKAKGFDRASRGELGPERVGKRDGQHPVAGGTLAAAGLAGIGTSIGTKQVLDAAVTRRLERAESLHRSSMALAGKPRQHEKAKKRVIEAANTNRKARVANALSITNPRSQNALRWGAGAVGGSLLYAGARLAARRPETASKADKRDVDAAAVGSVAGLLGYQGAGMAVSHRNSRHEKTIAQHPDLKRIERDYRKQVGVPGTHYQARKPSQRYFRNYPKTLPGSRTKRILSRTHGDNAFGIGSTIAAATLGAVGAVAARRKMREETASKALLRIPKVNYARRIGAGLTIRRPRVSGIRRYPSGVTATFRGTVR